MEEDVKKYNFKREKKTVNTLINDEIYTSFKELEMLIQDRELSEDEMAPVVKSTLETIKEFVKLCYRKYGEGLYRLEDLDVEKDASKLENFKQNIESKIKELQQCNPKSIESFFSKRQIDFRKELQNYPNIVSKAINVNDMSNIVEHNGYEIMPKLKEAEKKLEAEEKKREKER